MRTLKKPPNRLRSITPPANGGSIPSWTSKSKEVKKFKKNLSSWAIRNQQGRCAYCGLWIGKSARRSYAIEHFVPKREKTQPYHPHWRFEPLNLVVACDACNEKIKKTYDPIVAGSFSGNLPPRNYRKLTFSICHPYLADYRNEIAGGPFNGSGTPKPLQGLTDLGTATIKFFDLSDPYLFRSWYQEALYPLAGGHDRLRREQLIKRILAEQ